MRDMLQKIYENVITNEEAVYRMRLRIDKRVDELTKKYQEQLAPEEMEELRAAMYAVSLPAEQEGFRLGIQFTIRLLKEIHVDL